MSVKKNLLSKKNGFNDLSHLNETKVNLIQPFTSHESLESHISFICHVISCHITSSHISYHIISYHIISYHIISCHIISYHIIYHITSRHVTSRHILSDMMVYGTIDRIVLYLSFNLSCPITCCKLLNIESYQKYRTSSIQKV